MKLSVVVPTKNRPAELRSFLKSLWEQALLPDQLIIIDQSKKINIIKGEVEEVAKRLEININYVHDQNINGLVQAKAAAIPYNKCSIISFRNKASSCTSRKAMPWERTSPIFPEDFA